jgi:hypothetical protein
MMRLLRGGLATAIVSQTGSCRCRVAVNEARSVK